ncbi:MAG: BLUF domain-containing protein, partial [Sphingopyxis sp.]
MLSVIYVSVADPLVRDHDIAAILVFARRNNVRDVLTGALIYNGYNFM